MFTNKDARAECPATLDEAVANAKQLIADGKATDGLGIAMQIGEKGRRLPLVPAVHRRRRLRLRPEPDGTYNPDDMGAGKEGTIAAASGSSKLVNEGIFKASVSYDIAMETFNSGKSPYFITGPWQVPADRQKRWATT